MFSIFKKNKDKLANQSALGYYAQSAVVGNSVLEAIRGGGKVTAEQAIKNTAVMRSVELISRGIGMLPLYVMAKENYGKRVGATDHYLFDLLMHKPNDWQTAMEFKTLMQYRALFYGESVALKVKSGTRIVALQPLEPQRLNAKQKDDWSVVYEYTQKSGGKIEIKQDELFIVRGMSTNGYSGLSKVEAAADVLETARNAQIAANKIFESGMLGGGYLHSQDPRTPDVKKQLQEHLEHGFMGAVNAGRVPIIDGFEFRSMNIKGVDAQHLEMRNHQIEEICRVFGVPRPLIMLDATSWGSGIEQLSLLFITYTLAPWFISWEQAVNRSLLTGQDLKNGYYADFDERELLRGSMKDQAEYFTKALGGQKGWLTQNEVRNHLGEGNHGDVGADSITPAIAIGKEATSNVTQ